MGTVCVKPCQPKQRTSMYFDQVAFDLPYEEAESQNQQEDQVSEQVLVKPILAAHQVDQLNQILNLLSSEECLHQVKLLLPFDELLPNICLDTVMKIELGLLIIETFHNNEVFLSSRFQEYCPFVRRLHQLVYMFVEHSLKTLSLSTEHVRDVESLNQTLQILVEILHIIEHIQTLDQLWWIKPEGVLDRELIDNHQYVVDIQLCIEQSVISAGGKLKREVYTYHSRAAKQQQVSFQKEFFFKHKAERLKEKAIHMNQEKNSLNSPKTVSVFQVTSPNE